MHSVQAGVWDPRPPSKHAMPLPPQPPSNSRLTHVTTATPAKRITFYKSGDSQFGGIRMAIHKRSFKCFDALLDDLSQKLPLPFGVRTVTTPRGTHSIKHLEQLQDGACYLCSDRRHTNPVNMEVATKRANTWYHQSRRPQRPEEAPSGYRQRRILLVKNSEPGLRRSVVLSRRSTKSLRVFLDEVSEVMKFHVRKLYTLEGRRIDSVQSLMTCAGVLVCVGREAFSPVLVNLIRKSSEDKLPGLGTRSPGLGPRTPGNGARSPITQGQRSPPHAPQSRDSEISEGHDSKKNVNFGLETKKSIIHPRSDSSNRSARFSLSSEKSCSHGLSTSGQARPAIMNDDIEKRVLVNKDGSLSLEMRVRFRLHNDETLQWSTQINKSPSLTDDSCLLTQDQSHYLQRGQSDSCSDPDSTTFDPDGVEYANQALHHALESNHCHCCYHRQEQQYDLWENPAHNHKHTPAPPPCASSHSHSIMRHSHSSSSSSSCHSRRVVRCRARLSNRGGVSGSKQSQLVKEEVCMTEEVQRRVEVDQVGDTHVEVCMVSRCCSRSEVTAVDSNLRPHSRKSVEDEVMIEAEVEEERPLSVISNSSHVLQALKEDQDDEEDDLPPSASQCSNEASASPNSQTHLNPKPTSNALVRGGRAASSCHCAAASPHSNKSTKIKTPNLEEGGAAHDEDVEFKRAVSGLSGHTKASARSRQSGASSACPHCGGCKSGTNKDSRASQRSNLSQHAAPKPPSSLSNQENANDGGDDGWAPSGMSDGSDSSAVSKRSNKSNLTNYGCFSAMSNVVEDRASSAMTRTSNQSKNSGPSAPAEKDEERAPSATSATSLWSSRSHKSGRNGTTGLTAEIKEARSPSAMSAAQSNLSAKSNGLTTSEDADVQNTVERPVSAVSAKSKTSAKTSSSVKSYKSHMSNFHSEKAASPPKDTAMEDGDTNERACSALSVESDKSPASTASLNATDSDAESKETPQIQGQQEEDRLDSVLSAKSSKSNASAKSNTSHRLTCSRCETAVTPRANANDELDGTGKEEETEIEERATSAMSAKSNLSGNSNKSHSPTNDLERSEEGEERAASKMSARSIKSKVSAKSNCNGNATAASPSSNVTTEMDVIVNEPVGEKMQERSESVKSAKLENEAKPACAISSKSHESACNDDTGTSCEIEADNTEEVENAEKGDAYEDSAASVLSGKSAVSAKLNCDTGMVSPAKDTPEIEVDRTPSSMSGKSSKSQKSDRAAGSSSPNEVDTNEEEKQERVSCAMSGKSRSSVKSSISHETRGPSALSVHSMTSTKCKRSKCRCGADSPHQKVKKKDNELVKKEEIEEDKELNSEGDKDASERAPSILSSLSKRSKREFREALSHNSSGSISLGLPEDREQETADSDSGKSNISSNIHIYKSEAEVKTATPKLPKSTEEPETTSSSQGSVAVDIPTIKTPGGGEEVEEVGGETEEGAASAFSAKSGYSVKSSKSHKSTCNCSKAAISTKTVDDLETRSHLDTPENRASSAMSSSSAKVQSKSPLRASPRPSNGKATSTGDSANNETENQVVSRPASNASIQAKNPGTLRPELAASAHSGSKIKVSKQRKEEEKQDHNSWTTAKAQKAKSSAGSDSGSVQSVKTSRLRKEETAVKSPSPCPLHNSKPSIKVVTSTESSLSHPLSAADLLREKVSAERPHSQDSKASAASGKTRSEKSGKSHKNRNQKDQEEELQVTPACLPSTSPNEVISDWLRSIPANSCMLTAGDELNQSGEEQEDVEEQPEKDAIMEEEEEDPGDGSETEGKARVEEEEVKEERAECDEAKEDKRSEAAAHDVAEALPRNCHSSAAVMKVLLSPSLGRCHSLPEVSPVYGRRLSTSAKVLLDCLAQLHLSQPAGGPGCEHKDRNQHYEEIMTILQSLWLTETRDTEDTEAKDGGKVQVTPPRSSSGVDTSSGSGVSGKENGNRGEVETPSKQASLHADKGVEGVAGEEENHEAGDKECMADEKSNKAEIAEESPKSTEDPSSSDKSSANNSSKSPTDNDRDTLEDSSSGTPPTDVQVPLAKPLSQDPDPTWVLNLLKKVEKQFMSHYSTAIAEFKVRWDLDDSLILDTMISELRDEVGRRIQSSIEREVKKIQSRAGRGGRSPRPPQRDNLSRESTMTERRRRLLKVMKNQSVKTGDSLSDGEMTGEFSDQRSEDEYCPCDACVRKKMAARPLKMKDKVVEAPVMMEFDLRKILQLKKSPAPPPAASPEAVKEEGDRVFVDEGGRHLEVVQEEEEEAETKEDIKPDVVLEETIPEEDEEEVKETEKDEEGRELVAGVTGEEDVKEEEEEAETKEENEEKGDGNEEDEDEVHTEGNTGEEEAGEEKTENDEEEEEGEVECTCHVDGNEEKSNKGEEEEREKEAECNCQTARNEEESDEVEEGEGETVGEEEEAEETSNNTSEDEEKAAETETAEKEGETGGNEGETGTGEEEDESEKETIKGATGGQGEITENGDKQEERGQEEEEAEECVVSEFKFEEGETTGRESEGGASLGKTEGGEGEEKDTANTATNEESTPVEEFVEAEDEDDGDDGIGEGGLREDKEEIAATQKGQQAIPSVCVTEGEEADGEDSDGKRPSDSSADELGNDVAETTADEAGGDGNGEVTQDTVEEFKPEEEEGGGENVEVTKTKRDENALVHQYTRTSVESQPGSMEESDAVSPANPIASAEVQQTVPKMAAGVSVGGKSPRRSRSPARVKRRKPKETDGELDDFEL